jgi:hypothetical protein
MPLTYVAIRSARPREKAHRIAGSMSETVLETAIDFSPTSAAAPSRLLPDVDRSVPPTPPVQRRTASGEFETFGAIVRTAAGSANPEVQMVEIFARNADSLFIEAHPKSSRSASREMISRLFPFTLLVIHSFSLAAGLRVAVGITRPSALLTGRTALG